MGDQHSGKTKTMKPQLIDYDKDSEQMNSKAVDELWGKKGEPSAQTPKGKAEAAAPSPS